MKRLLVMAGAVLLAGCESGLLADIAGTAPAPAAPVAPAANVEGVVLGALLDPGLPKGACGMVLWTLDDDRPAPIFRYVVGEGGEIVVQGVAIPLALVEADGVAAFGVYEDQLFRSETGLEAHVAARFSLGFDGGSYLERGLVTVVSPDGWRTVSPTAGIAGCRVR